MSLCDRFVQVFPGRPKFTENDVPSLEGKVYLITGGKDLAQILYSKHAKVYIAARSPDKAQKAIESIKAATPSSKGELVFLPLDLADLRTIKGSVDKFLASETKLHVLFNNAGVMLSPNEKTAQGLETHLGVNNVGPFLLTRLLTPILLRTARSETAAAATVRVVWVSSSAAEGFTPGGNCVPMDNLDYRRGQQSGMTKYGISKAGNYLQATEYARRYRDIVSIPLNPGNLRTELWRNQGRVAQWVLDLVLLYPSIYGTYTELFAGLSSEVTAEKSGKWVGPWGRFFRIRDDIYQASKPKDEGGTGLAVEFWEWCEEQIKPHL